MGLQHYTQDMSRIPLKYHTNVLFYTKYTHPTLIYRGRTDARTDGRTEGWTVGQKIFTQYSGINSCSQGSTYNYFNLSIIAKPFDDGLEKHTRKAAHPLSGVASSNPCRWRCKRLHHHGDSACEVICAFCADLVNLRGLILPYYKINR